jgi:hypothetical protein
MRRLISDHALDQADKGLLSPYRNCAAEQQDCHEEEYFHWVTSMFQYLLREHATFHDGFVSRGSELRSLLSRD